MKIEIEVTRKDWLNFYKYISRPQRKKLFIIYLVLISIFNLLFWAGNDGDLTYTLLKSVIVTSLICLIAILSIFLQNKSAASIPAEDGYVIGKKTYTLSHEGFEEETLFNKSIFYWSSIRNLVRTEEYIYVFIDKTSSYIIPLRTLSLEEQDRIYAELKAKTGK